MVTTVRRRADGRMLPTSARVFEDSAAHMEQSIRALREWIAADQLEVVEDRPDEGLIELVLPHTGGELVMRVTVT